MAAISQMTFSNIFLNENVGILNYISLKCVPFSPIQIMAWR